MAEWIDDRNPDEDGRYLVTYREFAKKEYDNILFEHPMYNVYQRIMRYINGKWTMPRAIDETVESKITREVLAWKPLDDDYCGPKCWHEWQITAYNKDRDYYKVLKTGTTDEIKQALPHYHELCQNGKLVNNGVFGPEPFDWVFIEPKDSDGSLPMYFIDDIDKF